MKKWRVAQWWPRCPRPRSVSSPLPHRQLLKTELGSFFTEYLQVGSPAGQKRQGRPLLELLLLVAAVVSSRLSPLAQLCVALYVWRLPLGFTF